MRIKNLALEEEKIIKSFSLEYQDIIKELVKQKSQNSELYSSELTKELFRLENEFKEKKSELASLKRKKDQISTLDADIEALHEEIDKVSGKLSILKMGMTAEDVIQIMGPRFNYDGRCGNFGKYVLVFTNNTLIKACKIGEIYTQFGEYAVVNDCEDCDDMEVKNLLKY
jgi:predicted RNase H-like nuclease (RuvC/YqgF family)